MNQSHGWLARKAAPIFFLALSVANTPALAAVGKSPQGFDVTQTGAASYQVPIWVPPGIRGLAPQLSLEYNSQSGSGLLGVGWNVRGLQTISRCRPTFAQDSAPGPITLTSQDRFCINGKRLQLTSGVYGQPGSTYQTEIADFARVTAYGSAGDGPAYFVVESKNGRISEFGNTTDSRVLVPGTSVPRTWAVNRTRDRDTNYIDFTYVGSSTDGSYRPDEVRFTGNLNQSLSPAYSVKFVYSGRGPNDHPSGYYAGVLIRETQRLVRVQVRHGSQLLKNYGISGTATPGYRTRIGAITECADAASTDCLAQMHFDYQSAAPPTEWNSETPLDVSTDTRNVALVDLNGDGQLDLLFAESPSFASVCYSIRGTTAFRPKVCTSLPWHGTAPAPVGNRWVAYARYMSGRVMDMNGDGAQEYLQFNRTASQWELIYLDETLTLRSRLLGFTDRDHPVSDAYKNSATTVGDVNGDGLTDIVYAHRWYLELTERVRLQYPEGFWVRYSDGTNFSAPTLLLATTFLEGQYVIPSEPLSAVGDINGDGRTDFLAHWTTLQSGGVETHSFRFLTSGAGSPSGTYDYLTQRYHFRVNPAPPAVADFNGDGISDLQWQDTIAYGTGSRANPYTTFAFPASLPTGARLIAPADMDGDGRSDLLYVPAGQTMVHVAPSWGDSFGTGVSTGITDTVGDTTAFLDVNGDGLVDRVSVPQTAGAIEAFDRNGVPTDLMTSANDGFGNFAYFQHNALAHGFHNHNAHQYPLARYTGPLQIVHGLSITYPGASYSTVFRYQGAAVDRQGRGFAGFASRTVTDNRTSLSRTEFYEQVFPSTGVPLGAMVTKTTGSIVLHQRSESLQSVQLEAAAGRQRYFTYPHTTWQQNYKEDGSGSTLDETVTERSFDSYGNLLSSIATTTDVDANSPTSQQIARQIQEFTYTPDAGVNWCVGIPTSSTGTSTSFGNPSPVVRDVTWDVDYQKCRISGETIEPAENQLRVDRDLHFDDFGNVESETISAPGVAARTTTTNWGTLGVLPMTVTNALRQLTTFDYDFGLGVRTSITDPNGLNTTFEYDRFGRVTRERRPDSTSITISRRDCSGSSYCITNARMEFLVSERDTNDQVISDQWLHHDSHGRTIAVSTRAADGTYSRVISRFNWFDQLDNQTAPCEFSQCASVGTTSYSYDNFGRITEISRPTSESDTTLLRTRFAYDGRKTTVTDPQNKVTSSFTNPFGWVTRSTDHSGYYQTYSHDGLGNVLTVVDSQGNSLYQARYDYGLDSFPYQVTDMDRGTWRYVHNGLGEVTSWTDAKNQSFSATYDLLSRLTFSTMPNGIVTQWRWGTSATDHNIGSLESVERRDVWSGGSSIDYQRGFTYDGRGRLSEARETVVDDVTCTGCAYSYTYSATSGRLDVLTYPTSTASYRLSIKHEYQNGWLSRLRNDSDPGRPIIWQTSTRSPRGAVTGFSLGPNSGVVVSRAFDAVTGLLSSTQTTRIGTVPVQNESYLYDAVGNVVQRQDLNAGLTEDFFYDDLYRLDRSERVENGNRSVNLDLSYDSLGNITSRSDVAGGALWTYHPTRKHQIDTAGDPTSQHTYDANGNVTRRSTGDEELNWTYENQLKSVCQGNVCSILNYAPDGQRTSQLSDVGWAIQASKFQGELFEEMSWSASAQRDYFHTIYAEGEPVAVYKRSTGNISPSWRYLLSDHQGSITSMVDEASLDLDLSYEAFGARRDPATWSGAPSSGEVSIREAITRLGYTGASMMPFGLVHMRGRVLDPQTGRFLSADPLGIDALNTQTFNRYSYVTNNPLTYRDPTGFWPESNCIAFCDWTPGLERQIASSLQSSSLNVISVSVIGFGHGWSDFDEINRFLASSAAAGTTPTNTWLSQAATRAGQVTSAVAEINFNDVVNFSAGFGDVALSVGTLGASDGVEYRSVKNIGSVDLGSTAYEVGYWTAVFGSVGVGRAFARAPQSRSPPPLARVLEGHGYPQGFSGVYDAATGRVLIAPSPSMRNAPVPAGWVSRSGGHADVSTALGGNSANHSGFAVMLQRDGSLAVTWRSGTLNPAPGYAVPPDLRPGIVRAIERATGRTVSQH